MKNKKKSKQKSTVNNAPFDIMEYVRLMMDKVIVRYPGDTTLRIDSVVDMQELNDANDLVSRRSKAGEVRFDGSPLREAKADPVVRYLDRRIGEVLLSI